MASPVERAILVTEIPYVTDDVDQLKDKLETYFGKRGNGGGDVDFIICPVAGSLEKAIVVFESSGDAIPERVTQHGDHTFEDEVINVAMLPPMYSHVDVELERYYWDILPRDTATPLIASLKSKFGDANISCGKHRIDKLRGSIDELEAIKEIIPKTAGIGSSNKATASTVTSEILARSVEVTNIPFITDDVDKLKTYLEEAINDDGSIKVEDIIAPIGGKMETAIIVFESTAGKDAYLQQENHRFKDEEITVHALPEVFREVKAVLNKFYMQLIPKKKVEPLRKKITATYGSDTTLTDTEITGPLEHLMDIRNIWLEEVGLKSKTSGGMKSKGADGFLIPVAAGETEPNREVLNPADEVEEDIYSPNIQDSESESLTSWTEVKNVDVKESSTLKTGNEHLHTQYPDSTLMTGPNGQTMDSSMTDTDLSNIETSGAERETFNEEQREQNEQDESSDSLSNWVHVTKEDVNGSSTMNVGSEGHPSGMKDTYYAAHSTLVTGVDGRTKDGSKMSTDLTVRLTSGAESTTRNEEQGEKEPPIPDKKPTLTDNKHSSGPQDDYSNNADGPQNMTIAGQNEETLNSEQSTNTSDLTAHTDNSTPATTKKGAISKFHDADVRDNQKRGDDQTQVCRDLPKSTNDADPDKERSFNQPSSTDNDDKNDSGLRTNTEKSRKNGSRSRFNAKSIAAKFPSEQITSGCKSPDENSHKSGDPPLTDESDTSGETRETLDHNEPIVATKDVEGETKTQTNVLLSVENASDSERSPHRGVANVEDGSKVQHTNNVQPAKHIPDVLPVTGSPSYPDSYQTQDLVGEQPSEPEASEEVADQFRPNDVTNYADSVSSDRLVVTSATNNDTSDRTKSSSDDVKDRAESDRVLHIGTSKPTDSFAPSTDGNAMNLGALDSTVDQQVNQTSDPKSPKGGDAINVIDITEDSNTLQENTATKSPQHTTKDVSGDKYSQVSGDTHISLIDALPKEIADYAGENKPLEDDPEISEGGVTENDVEDNVEESASTQPADQVLHDVSGVKSYAKNSISISNSASTRKPATEIDDKRVRESDGRKPTESDDNASSDVLSTAGVQDETTDHEVEEQSGIHSSNAIKAGDGSNETGLNNIDQTTSAAVEYKSSDKKVKPPNGASVESKFQAKNGVGNDNVSEGSKLREGVENQSSANKPTASSKRPYQTEDGSSDEEQIEDYISVDALTYAYIKKTCTDKLSKITKKCKIQIQTPDPKKPNDQTALFIPKQTAENVSASERSDAREKFISLYQDNFFKLERKAIQLKSGTVTREKTEQAKKVVEQKTKNVVIGNGTDQEYIFCGEKKYVDEAIKVFREVANIMPKKRKLKQSNTDAAGVQMEASNWQQGQEKTLPSVFHSNEGLKIIVLRDDLTKQKVDAIVNAANGRLDHGGGVAGAISRAAGKQLQRDCNWMMNGRASVPIGQCIETKSYNLPCQYIIHAVGPTYDSRYGDYFFHTLINTFTNVLQFAATKNSKTIAIPLISSGNFGGPKEVCTNALATAIYNFSSSNENKSLQQIFLVNIDQEATSALQRSFSDLYPTRDDAEAPDEPHDSYTTSNSATKYQTDEGIEIVVVKGDITKGNIEVIVNAANGHLNHGSGVAGAIARAAGKKIQDESNQIITRRKKSLQVGECEVTDGYNLNCKVIHAVGPMFRKFKSKDVFYGLLKKTFLEALRRANIPIEAKQVALPLISSGIFGGPKDLCAKALTEAVIEFSRKEKYLVIKQIFLVNIDDETTDAVRSAFQAVFSPDSVAGSLEGENIPVGTKRSIEKRNPTDGPLLMSSRGITLNVLRGDITKLDVDVIVNPTSPTLRHNGGVAGAISDAAGVTLQRQCNYILKEDRNNRTLSVGDTVVTSAFQLPCRHIIHTLGPVFEPLTPKNFYQSLLQTVLNCMKVANSTMQVKTMAFPLIGSSSGPKETCAKAFADAVGELDQTEPAICLSEITLVTADDKSYTIAQKYFTANFPNSSQNNKSNENLREVNSHTQANPQMLAENNEHVFKTAENMELIVRTDNITKQSTDVIVNSTDDKLTNTSQTSKLLCEAAGPKLLKECQQLMKNKKGSPYKPGECVATGGYQLPCKRVLHVSRPTRQDKQSEEVFSGFLRSTYLAFLLFARTTLRAKSIAIPLIGSEQESAVMCATATASAVKQFSKQTCAYQSHFRIYFVNSTQTSTTAIKNAFHSEFELVRQGIFQQNESVKSREPSSNMSNESHISSRVAVGATNTITQQPVKERNESGIKMKSNDHPQPAKPSTQSGFSDRRGEDSTGARRKETSAVKDSERCQICKDSTKKLHTLEGCCHVYCNDCICKSISPGSACQECGALYGKVSETHLNGTMTYFLKKDLSLKGSQTPGSICMTFEIPSGIQKTNHPRPRCEYSGMTMHAYLPASNEAQEILWLLKSAFLGGLMFHMTSYWQGRRRSERVELADIPLKTKTIGKDGYPDPDYLRRVKKLLNEKGVKPYQYDEGTEL